MERNDIVKLAIDATRGCVAGNYSKGETSEVLRQALIEANGGSTKIDYKAIRRNGAAIFEIIEEIIPVILQEGLVGDEFYMNLVEERRLAEGDTNEFEIEADSAFVVSEIANGVATPRRQRIGEKTSTGVKTTAHAVRVYEEMNRLLAGRIDWNTFIEKVAEAFRQQLFNDIYTAFSGINAQTAGLSDTYVTGGTYDEEKLLALVAHVEAATGKTAMIVGTKPALRKCTTAVVADSAKEDYYNAGFYGRLAGVPMVAIKNRHAAGTENFIFGDDKLFVMASDDKPIKVVYEGDGLILDVDPTSRPDLTQEYFYMEKYGVALIVNGKMGIFTLA